MTRPRPVALLAAAWALAAGCTGASHPSPPTSASPISAPRTPSLPAAPIAALAPCPVTSGRPVPTGLPRLTLPCLGPGPAVDLAGLRGRPALVNLWASWCEPCQGEVPALERAYRLGGGRLVVLGVDLEDSRAGAADFARRAGMTYPSVVDPSAATLHELGYPGPPVTVFLDAAGRVRHISAGPLGPAAQVAAAVDRYLGLRLDAGR